MTRCFAAGLLFAVLIAAPAAGLERVTVSHSIRGGLSIGPLLYGIERGFYRDEGIDMLYVSIRADLGIKAMLAGEIDYIYSAGTAIRAAVRGVPVKALSFDFYKVFHSLMGRPEIKSAGDLKGKKVAVSSFGATADLSARVSLRAIGLDPVKDVAILALGPDAIRYAAIQSGAVQASIMPLPWNVRMKREGYNELFYAGKVFHQPLTGLMTTTDKIEKNPDQVRRTLRAFARSSRALKDEKKEFLSFVRKKLGIAPDVAEEAYGYLIDAMSQDGFVDDALLQTMLDDERKLAGVAKSIGAAEVVDYRFLREAVAGLKGRR
jgi:ABC-type nitrate/sulfonate/bicarbonate transport system substrate-binding protein